MEILRGIVVILGIDLVYLAILQFIDYKEKGNHKKLYSAKFAKFFMIRFTRQIGTWEEEERRTKRQIRLKDDVNGSTISMVSFWLQLVHIILLSAVLLLEILNDSGTFDLEIATRVIRLVYVFLIPVLAVAYSIRNNKNVLEYRKKKSRD